MNRLGFDIQTTPDLVSASRGKKDNIANEFEDMTGHGSYAHITVGL